MHFHAQKMHEDVVVKNDFFGAYVLIKCAAFCSQNQIQEYVKNI